MSLIFAALLAGAAGNAVPSTPPVVSPEASTTEIIETENERYARLTVPVTIMGAGPFNFMIDTGAQATVLSRALADELQLQDRQTATLIGMASRQAIETTMVPNFRLGSRNLYIRTAPLVEGVNIGSADGILGIDSLQDQRVLIDFDKNFIAVDEAKELGGNRGYEIIVKARRRLGQLIITRARLNGIRTAVVIDTGATGSIGNLALLNKLRRARHLGDTEMTDINGQQLIGVVRVADKLQMNDVQLRNFPIVFADAPPFHALGLADEPALVLGMSELKMFRRVAIDFKTQRVLFDLPRGIRGPNDFSRMSWGV